MTDKIFISYRRDDARADARDLHNRLCQSFGKSNVFMDVDNLLVGQRFDEKLKDALNQCDVFLAIMGPRWMELFQERQASGQKDYVRDEIAAAIKHGAIVIPVLVDGADLPSPDELTKDLSDLVLYQAHRVNHHSFGRDVDDLVIGIKASRIERDGGPSRPPINLWVATLSFAVLVLAGGYTVWTYGQISITSDPQKYQSGSVLPTKTKSKPIQINGRPRTQNLEEVADLQTYMKVSESGDLTLAQEYIRVFPNGRFIGLVRVMTKKLEGEQKQKQIIKDREIVIARAEEAEIAAEKKRLIAAEQARKLSDKKAKQAQIAKAKEAEAEQERAKKTLVKARQEISTARKIAERTMDEVENDSARAIVKAKLELNISDDVLSKSVQSFSQFTPRRDNITIPRSIALNRTKKIIAIGADDGIVRIFRWTDWQLISTINPANKRIEDLSFSGDDRQLAIATRGGSIFLWDVKSQTTKRIISGSENAFYSVDINPDYPRKYLGAGARSGRAYAFDIKRNTVITRAEFHQGPVLDLAYRPKAKGWFVSAGGDGKLKYRRSKGRGRETIMAHRGGAFDIDFSVDGSFMVSGGADKSIKVWPNFPTKVNPTKLKGHTLYVLSVAISDNKKFLASGGGDKNILLWDAQTNQISNKLTGHRGDIEDLQFFSNDQYILSASEDRSLRLWDVASKKNLLRFYLKKGSKEYVGVSSNGAYFGTKKLDQFVKAATGTNDGIKLRYSSTAWPQPN